MALIQIKDTTLPMLLPYISFYISLTAFWDFGPVSGYAEDGLLTGLCIESVSGFTLVLDA